MNVDFGEVLRRAWQITWKHKVLWILGALPLVPVLFYVPLILYYFLSNDLTKTLPELLSSPGFIAIVFLILILTAAISFLLHVFSRSATTFGIIQVTDSNGHPSIGELFKNGGIFFWRTLGGMLLVGVGTTVLFAVVSACLSLVGFATFGLGSLLGQLLFLPMTLLSYAIMEQTQVAIVADRMRPTGAITRAWELIKQHIELFALVTVVLYFGLSLIGSLVMLPVIAPLLLAVLGKFSGEFSGSSLPWVALSCFVAMMPVYLLVRAVTLVYMKSVHVITYLRLTRSPKLQPLPGNLGATS